VIRTRLLGAVLFFVLVALDGPARADLVLSIANLSGPTAGAGTFEVLLSSTGPPGGLDFDVASFSFGLNVPVGSGVEFTGADTATVSAPYLFAGVGIGSVDPGFQLSPDVFPNSSFTGADVALAVPSITVHPGDAFGLGFIGYSVIPGAPGGMVQVSFDAVGTSLSDPSGNAIDFTTDASGGAIRISAVPEPCSLTLVATALLAIAITRGSRGEHDRRCRGASATSWQTSRSGQRALPKGRCTAGD
jgi:hypothetical protein